MIAAALLAKYDSLTLPEACPIYLDMAPTADADGDLVDLPYTVLSDVATIPDYSFELNPLEKTTFTLTVYAPTLARASAVAEAVKYNGSRPALCGGFDFTATLPDLDTAAYRHLSLIRLREQVRQLPDRGTSARLAFAHVLSYEHTAQRLV